MIELQEFFVEGGQQERSHVLLHITEPSTREERAKGYFFALSEITRGTDEQIEHLQELIDDFETRYYATPETETKDAFETTLESINRRGHHILQYRGSAVHCVLGVLRGTTVSLSYHGAPTAMLFYRRGESVEHLNIIETGEDESTPEHLFSAILQGSMNSGDYLYFSTPSVDEYLPVDRIGKLLVGRTTKQVADHIHKVLIAVRQGTSYGGIIAHALTPDEKPRTGKQPKYIDDLSPTPPSLSDREAATQAVLSPPLLRGTKEKEKVTETNYRPREDSPRKAKMSVGLSLGRAIVTGLLGLYRLLKRIVLALGRASVALILVITNKGGQRTIVLESLERQIQRKKNALENLPFISKIFIVLIIISVVVFAAGVGVIQIKRARDASRQAYLAMVADITANKDEAEAKLLYGDESSAFTLLDTATRKLEGLPAGSTEEKARRDSLAADIHRILEKVQKLTYVTPEVIADLASVQTDAKGEKITRIDASIIGYGPDDTHLYLTDIDTKRVAVKDHQPLLHLSAASTPKEHDTVVFQSDVASIAAYDKTTMAVTTRDIEFPETGTTLRDVFVYNQRLYTLDSAHSQIYRHTRTQTGYDKGVSWLKEPVDLATGISMAIDGDIYVLKQNGEIVKLEAGRRNDFTISGLSPTLSAPTQIWTYNGVDELFILEPISKRIIVLDKNGKLIRQYTAREWQQPTGMVVDPEKKIMYILDSNKLYQFSLQ